MADHPRFRQDLVAEPIEDGGSKFIDVMDPDSGVLFRFFEVEYSLACAMDGQRDVAGIVRWADEELGLKTNANEVKVVMATLGDLGFIDTGSAAAGAAIQAPAAAAAVAAAAAPAAKQAPAAPEVAKKPEQPAYNRWDAPTAMGDADEYLAQGVVTGGGAKAASSGADVELGAPGARPNQPRTQTPQPADLELGAPGATAKSRTPAKGADIALGASGAAQPDVSMDLANDFNVGAADVKEAVRASQVMKAVDIPPELAAELEAPAKKPAEKAAQPAAKPVEKAAEKPVAKPVEKAAQPAAKQPEKVAEKPADKTAKPADKKPADKAATKPADKAATKPADKPIAPPAPRSGVSPVLIASLVIAILAAGGFAVYKFVIKKGSSSEQTVKTPPPPPKPEPPPPPPVESQKLATEQPAPEELKPADAHQIAWIAANDTAVKAGDTVAKYVGFKSLEGEALIARALADKAKSDPKADDKAKEAAEKKAEDKQAALDKFLLKAPAAGKVTAVAKLNAKVTPTDVVATLQRDAILVATFKNADGATENAAVLLAVKGSDQKLPCNVVLASGDGTKIACPAGAAPDGTEVTFAGVDASRPPGTPGETPAPTPTPAETGSAAPATGSDAAPAAGSAAPAAGSAAAPAPTPKAHPPAHHAPHPAAPHPAAPAGSAAAPAADTTPAPAPAAAGSGT